MFKLALSKIPQGQLARGAAISLFWQLTRIALLAGWVILVARLLGPQGYGQLSGIAGLAVTIGSFTGLGFGLVMYQDTIRNPTLFSDQWHKTFIVTILSGLLLCPLFIAVSLLIFNGIEISTLLAIGASEVIFYPLMTGSAFAFAAKNRLGWSAALPAIMALVRFFTLILFFLLSMNMTIDNYVWYHLTATVIASMVTILLVNKYLQPTKVIARINRQDIYKGLSFCASWTSTSALLSLDKSIVLKVGGAEIAGLYSLAFRWASIFIQPIDALVSASMPKLFRQEIDKFGASTTIKYLFITLAIYGVISGCILWISPTLIIIVLGDGFTDASEIIKWFSLLIPCYGIRALTTNILMTSNRIRLKLFMECGGVCLMLTLGYLLIPLNGLKGAAIMLISTEVALAIVGSTMVLMSRKHI